MYCPWHQHLIAPADAVLVGAEERGSGPPRLIYACQGAVDQFGIVPFDEHPDGTDGRPLFTERRFAATRDGTPEAIPPAT